MKTGLSIPAAKLKMMNASLRCLTFGVLGLLVPLGGVPFLLLGFWLKLGPLIPFVAIGIFFALAGLMASFKARKMEKEFWNPAQPHRIFGWWCALAGVFIWSVVDTILIGNLINQHNSN